MADEVKQKVKITLTAVLQIVPVPVKHIFRAESLSAQAESSQFYTIPWNKSLAIRSGRPWLERQSWIRRKACLSRQNTDGFEKENALQ